MKAGKLLPIADFKLETSYKIPKPLRLEFNDTIPDCVETAQPPNSVVPSSPEESHSALTPPTPESFPSQDIFIPQAGIARRASVLSPKRPSAYIRPQQPQEQKPKKFLCSGNCPELLCSHRPELALPKSSSSQNLARFTNLTGYSPKLRRQSQYEVPKLSAQSIVHPHHGALPSLHSTGSKLDSRFAQIKADLESFKSPTAKRVEVKKESPSTFNASVKHTAGVSRSSSISARFDLEVNTRQKRLPSKARDRGPVDHYREKYEAPILSSPQEEEDIEVLNTSSPSTAPSGIESPVPKDEDHDGYSRYPGTPVSVK